MIIKKLSLPRRTFLRGVGATVALPLLDAMVPALSGLVEVTTRAAAAPVRRLGFVYIPNGAVMQQWTPAEVGAGFEIVDHSASARAVSRPVDGRQRSWLTVRPSRLVMGTVSTHGPAPPG